MVSFAEYLDERNAPYLGPELLLLLQACANYPPLQSLLVLKGGLLCSLKWRTGRATRDVDFTAPALGPSEGTAPAEARETLKQLFAAAMLSHEPLQKLHFSRVNSVKIHSNNRPMRADLKLHFLPRNASTSALEGFRKGFAVLGSTLLDVDVAFLDRRLGPADVLELPDGSSLSAYSSEEQVAEKLRALILEDHKLRRQDLFDIYKITRHYPIDRLLLLNLLQEKARMRLPPRELNRSSLTAQVLERQRKGYGTLADEVVRQRLPDFDVVAAFVLNVYDMLPWND